MGGEGKNKYRGGAQMRKEIKKYNINRTRKIEEEGVKGGRKKFK